MKNATSTKRTDNKGRILKTGESQRTDGRYAYKYLGTDGKAKFLYSWRLNDTDPIPKGKRKCKSLREIEKEILRDKMDGIDSIGKKMTVCQLYEKQNALKPNVRKSTVNGSKQLMDILKADKQEKALLSFVQMDSIYSKYYRAIVILLNTGLRISELCGLTVNDIDFENGFINIDHQIVHDRNGYYIAPPKTENSVRQIPMLKCVRKALKEEIRSRKNIQPMLLDGCSNFIFLNSEGLSHVCKLIFGNVLFYGEEIQQVQQRQVTENHTSHYASYFLHQYGKSKNHPEHLAVYHGAQAYLYDPRLLYTWFSGISESRNGSISRMRFLM